MAQPLDGWWVIRLSPSHGPVFDPLWVMLHGLPQHGCSPCFWTSLVWIAMKYRLRIFGLISTRKMISLSPHRHPTGETGWCPFWTWCKSVSGSLHDLHILSSLVESKLLLSYYFIYLGVFIVIWEVLTSNMSCLMAGPMILPPSFEEIGTKSSFSYISWYIYIYMFTWKKKM